MATVTSIFPSLFRYNIISINRIFTKRFYCTRSNSKRSDVVTVQDYGPVRVIKINRPEVRNAVNKRTALELFKVFRQFDSDSSVLVGILAGSGGNFCAGYDLKELSQGKQKLIDDLTTPYSEAVPAPMGPSRLVLNKPVIASLSGFAVAGGIELALWCHLRVAESDVTLGFYNRRFGVPLIDGGTVRLPALIGLSRALDLILTGRSVDATEAYNIGLVNRVVPVGDGLKESIKLAKHIASFPQSCLRHDYRSAINSTTTDIQTHLANEYNTAGNLLKEAISGAQKFSDGFGRSGKLH